MLRAGTRFFLLLQEQVLPPAIPRANSSTPFTLRSIHGAPSGTYVDPTKQTPLSGEGNSPSEASSKWWSMDGKWSAMQRRDIYDPTKKMSSMGTLTPEYKRVPNPQDTELEFEDTMDSHYFFGKSNVAMFGQVLEPEQRMLAAPKFNPELDDLEEDEYSPPELMLEVMQAAEADKKRLSELGNPVTADEALQHFLEPNRKVPEAQRQREDFNGFVHWGILHAANVALRNGDQKMAHQLVNRYLRDLDLFEKWLEHEKVRAHMKKKFQVETKGALDRLMCSCMALYVRSKIQVYESDFPGALRSLVASINMIRESGDLKNARHRKALGVLLASRGFIYLKLESPERSVEDLTQSLPFLPAKRCATVHQLRAEALEKLGKIEEARLDEEKAADIMENAEVIHPGLDQPPQKWVM